MEKHYKLLSGVVAFFVYFLLLGLLINYFNHHKTKKAIHYVEKSDKRIVVSLSDLPRKTKSPKKSKNPKMKSKPRPKPKPKPKPEPKSKKVLVKKKTKETRSSIRSPKAKEEESKKKKVNIHNLFKKVKEKKPIKKTTKKSPKAPDKNKKTRDRGIQNAYFAKVEKMLQAWPAQSEFAGETIKVWLRIRQDGSFRFRVLSASGNAAFNNELIQFLKQLQKIGFGRHQNAKPYELNVEFIAKE